MADGNSWHFVGMSWYIKDCHPNRKYYTFKMLLILGYLSLLFMEIQANGNDCPNSYFPLSSEKVCLHVSTRAVKLDDMKSYCTSEASGGKPFFRRLTEEGLEELQQYLWNTFRSAFNPKVFVGIKKDTSFGSTKWIFANNEGSVEEKDYTLWTEDPSNLDCGVVAYPKGLGVSPQSCAQGTHFICQKDDEACESTTFRFIKYYGRCLTIIGREDNYQAAESFCEQIKSYLIPYKDKSQTNSIGSLIYNFNALDGGIYTGMKKDSETGKWLYPDGFEEVSRWDPTDSRDFDCAVTGFLSNTSLGLFTMKCESGLRFFCMLGE